MSFEVTVAPEILSNLFFNSSYDLNLSGAINSSTSYNWFSIESISESEPILDGLSKLESS